MKRQNKFRTEFIVQGRYPAHGSNRWEDENTEDSWKEGLRSLREYRANGPGSYRLIRRRVPNTEHPDYIAEQERIDRLFNTTVRS